MKEFLLNIFKKYREYILYVFFGGLTTLVNIASYAILAHPLHIGTVPSTAVAWLLGVIFAYVTNKIWVFESKRTDFRSIAKEFISFFACRLFSGLVDLGIMWLFVDVLHFNDILIKIISNIIVIIINYVASKCFVFKEGQK